MEKINKQTLLGIACAACGIVTDDQRVLDRAIYRSWTCPACGARNLSLNDVAASSHVIEVKAEPEAEQDGGGTESTAVVQSTPAEIEQLKREFLNRKSL